MGIEAAVFFVRAYQFSQIQVLEITNPRAVSAAIIVQLTALPILFKIHTMQSVLITR